jgi:hypothetical protein
MMSNMTGESRCMAPAEVRRELDSAMRAITPRSTAKEVERALMWCGSHERPDCFLDVHRRAFARRKRSPEAHATFWRWLATIWSGFDRIAYDLYIPAFALHRPGWAIECMLDEERQLYESLPDEASKFIEARIAAPRSGCPGPWIGWSQMGLPVGIAAYSTRARLCWRRLFRSGMSPSP